MHTNTTTFSDQLPRNQTFMDTSIPYRGSELTDWRGGRRFSLRDTECIKARSLHPLILNTHQEKSSSSPPFSPLMLLCSVTREIVRVDQHDAPPFSPVIYRSTQIQERWADNLITLGRVVDRTINTAGSYPLTTRSWYVQAFTRDNTREDTTHGSLTRSTVYSSMNFRLMRLTFSFSR